MTSPDPQRAQSFGEFAEEYARWRPSYPPEAVDWMLPAHAERVADVGAGTGKLTGELLSRGLAVDAVEPDPAMMSVLRRLFPEAVAHRGSAEALPLADHSVLAVLVADAWHWFDPERAVAEVRRVLRPGGWLALVWNLVKPLDRWERELAMLDPDRKGLQDDDSAGHEPRPTFPSDETTTASFPWTWQLTPHHVRAYLATNSAVARMDDEERRRRLDQAEAIAARECEQRGAPTVGLHHMTSCVRWRPRAGSTR